MSAWDARRGIVLVDARGCELALIYALSYTQYVAGIGANISCCAIFYRQFITLPGYIVAKTYARYSAINRYI